MKTNIRNATIEDLERAVELFNKESVAYSGKPAVSVEEIRQEWTVPGVDLEKDVRLVEDEQGRLVALIDYINNREPYVRPYAYCAVNPDFQDSYDCAELLAWARERAEADISRAPEDARFTLHGGAIDTNTRMLEAWTRAGFSESRRYYEMRLTFDGPPQAPEIAEGYDIRPMRPGEERAVYDALQEAFLDHYGAMKEVPDPDKAFARWKHYHLEVEGADPDLFLILVAPNGEIAGASLCHPSHAGEDDMGYVHSLAVRRQHRRKGLGEALLRASFVAFHRKGKARAGLGVDAASPTNATRLYTKCGMHQVEVFVEMSRVLRDGRELANEG